MSVQDGSWRNTATAKNAAQERSGEGIPDLLPSPRNLCQLNPIWGTQALQTPGVSLPGYSAGPRRAGTESGAGDQVEDKQHKEKERQEQVIAQRQADKEEPHEVESVCESGSEKGLSLFAWAGLLNPNPAHLRLLK